MPVCYQGLDNIEGQYADRASDGFNRQVQSFEAEPSICDLV